MNNRFKLTKIPCAVICDECKKTIEAHEEIYEMKVGLKDDKTIFLCKKCVDCE